MPVIAHRFGSTPSSAVALVGAGDPSSTRLVYSMVIGLVVIGLLLVVLGIWIIRQTRVDLDVLAPLERMGDGDWRKRDRSTQRRMLDEVRPDGARPLAPATQPPSLDDEFELAEHPVTSFSDLGPGVPLAEHPVTSLSDLGPGVPSEQRDPTPVGTDADPLSEPAIEPGADPVSESEVDSGVGRVSEVAIELEAESVMESDTEHVDDPVSESDAESASDPRS